MRATGHRLNVEDEEAEMTDQPNQGEETGKRAPASTGELKQVEPGLLTREEFQGLADLPPEAEWFANIRNKNTKRA